MKRQPGRESVGFSAIGIATALIVNILMVLALSLYYNYIDDQIEKIKTLVLTNIFITSTFMISTIIAFMIAIKELEEYASKQACGERGVD